MDPKIAIIIGSAWIVINLIIVAITSAGKVTDFLKINEIIGKLKNFFNSLWSTDKEGYVNSFGNVLDNLYKFEDGKVSGYIQEIEVSLKKIYSDNDEGKSLLKKLEADFDELKQKIDNLAGKNKLSIDEETKKLLKDFFESQLKLLEVYALNPNAFNYKYIFETDAIEKLKLHQQKIEKILVELEIKLYGDNTSKDVIDFSNDFEKLKDSVTKIKAEIKSIENNLQKAKEQIQVLRENNDKLSKETQEIKPVLDNFVTEIEKISKTDVSKAPLFLTIVNLIVIIILILSFLS